MPLYSKVILIFFAVMALAGIVMMNNSAEIDRNRSDAYFKKLNLEFTGRITSTQLLDHNAGVWYVDVITTNLTDYDPRDSLSYYYCVIKHQKAEFVEGYINQVRAGDSVVISCRNNRRAVFRAGTPVLEAPLYLKQYSSLYGELHKWHKL